MKEIKLKRAYVDKLLEIYKLRVESSNYLNKYYSNKEMFLMTAWEGLRSLQKDLSNKNKITIIAEKHNEIIGYGTLYPQNSLISSLFVHPIYFKQGIGSLIIKRLEKINIERGNSRIYVNSRLQSVKFYISHGYKKIKNTNWIIGKNKVKLVLFTKTISLS